MHRTTRRPLLLRTAVVALAASAMALGLAAPASAHVSITTGNTTAGSYTLLTFGVPHGCADEPTTEVAIQIPEQILAVTPSVNPNWEVEKVMTELDEPVADSHGAEVTERVSAVVYTTDDPLPSDLRDAFELSLRLPEETAGETLYFPVVQTCTESEHPWIQIPEDGQDPHDLDSPAPSIEVTAAADSGPAADDGEGDAEAAEPTEAEMDTASTESDEGSTDALTYVALAVGVLGVLMGGFALLRGRRSS